MYYLTSISKKNYRAKKQGSSTLCEKVLFTFTLTSNINFLTRNST